MKKVYQSWVSVGIGFILVGWFMYEKFRKPSGPPSWLLTTDGRHDLYFVIPISIVLGVLISLAGFRLRGPNIRPIFYPNKAHTIEEQRKRAAYNSSMKFILALYIFIFICGLIVWLSNHGYWPSY